MTIQEASKPTPETPGRNATEGWGWLSNATKWHYFRERYSLCGKWLRLADPSDGYEVGDDESQDNCVGCKRKRRVEIERATSTKRLGDDVKALLNHSGEST